MGGLISWLILLTCIKHTKTRKEEHDKKRIYNWLYNETKKLGNKSPYDYNYNPWWYDARDIARHNNLPIDRVEHICTIHKEIVLMGKEDLWPDQPVKEKWVVRKFVRD